MMSAIAFVAAAAALGLASRSTDGLASLEQVTPDVREILARAEKTYNNLSSLRARFTQTIEVPLLERTRTGSGVWYQKGRGRFKMEFEDPAGDVIVADGTYIWLYYPTTNPGQVIRSTIEARATGAHMVDLQGRIFEDAKTIYDAQYLLEEVVTDRPALLVELTPREASPYRRVRVWVDAENYLVRKFEITEENETVRTVELGRLEPDAAIPDWYFRFDPPPDVDLFQG